MFDVREHWGTLRGSIFINQSVNWASKVISIYTPSYSF